MISKNACYLTLFSVFLACASLQGSAEDGQDSSGSKKLLSLRVVPEQPTLWGADATQQFVVLGTFSDGLERDLTTRTMLTLSDTSCAAIDEKGRLRSLANGETVLTADVGEQVATASIRLSGFEETRPFDFERDIGGVVTRQGCNTSDCHGSVKGQEGFKLSLSALKPRADHRWMVEGGTYQVLREEAAGEKIPRVNVEEPEKSLILLKATRAKPHGGGKRFEKDSADYETLAAWIREGAPYVEGEVDIEQIEVFPKENVLEAKSSYQLLVTAHLSDGGTEDYTHRSSYESKDEDVVKVSATGLVKAVGKGETSIIVRAPGHLVNTRFGVITDFISDYPEVEPNNLIDERIFAKLRKLHIVPSDHSSDEEFLRRVCLDVTGTLPPPERVRQFLADPDPDKRNKLIEILLHSPEYIDYWTFQFADFFRVALYSGNSFPTYTHTYWEWIREAIAENRPYDQVARERIAVQGFQGPARHYFIDRPPHDLMAEQVRVFMGRRFDCAQCHDHPWENWTQDQFWGLTAFFGRFAEIGEYSQGIFIDQIGGHGDRGKGGPTIHPRKEKEIHPAFLNGKGVSEDATHDPRMELAKWMTSHPFFSEAAVNRMWSYFFGRGIVDPVDDFGVTNHATHPELLKALAEDFVQQGHDLKHLIRLIVQSRTYQLSSIPNETNKDDKSNYSHSLPRPLVAEVLLDAVSAVTEVPEEFPRLRGGIAYKGTRAVQLRESDTYPSIFLDCCGRPNRQMVPERNNDPNLRQALHTLAGKTFSDKLAREGGRIQRLLESDLSDRDIVEELSLAALSRFPKERETSASEELIKLKSPRREAIEDLVWGMVNSREFAHNH